MDRRLECPTHWEGAHHYHYLEVPCLTTLFQGTLLLPLESGGHTDITPDFARDHVALCESPSGDTIPIVTLSGLRGILAE